LSETDISASVILGDKAYGSQEIRDYITSNGGSYCIPPRESVKEQWETDFWRYKERHLVECFFQKIKNFRHIATRYDKLLSSYKAFVYLACIMILLK
jgi:transposase